MKSKATKLFALVLAIAMVLAITACGTETESTSESATATTSETASSEATPSETAAATESETSTATKDEEDPNGTHSVVDGTGEAVEIPNTINSIVVPAPAHAQILLGLGAVDLISGGSIMDSDMNNVMFGEQLEKNDVKNVTNSNVNAELVMSCDPDLVIITSSLDADLSSIEVPILVCPGGKYGNFLDSVSLIAEGLGTDEALDKADAYENFYYELRNTVESMTADIPEDEKAVVYVATGTDPTDQKNGDIVSQWVAICGGIYFTDVIGLDADETTEVTAEQIISADPDIIICTDAETCDTFVTDPTYAGLTAVQNGDVYLNPSGGSAWHINHYEAPLELAWAPTVIAPDYTDDLDTRAYVEEFFDTFYGYSITDADYETIMNPSA